MTAGTDELLTIDELSALTGLSVRNTRYYASLGLIPPPQRHGRIAYYGSDHRARLELVRALQDHGFTLQGIQRYLGRLADDVTVEDLAMQRAMITSWTSDDPDSVFARIGRELRELGVPKGVLGRAQEVTERHMGALATELTALMRDEVVDPFKRTHHTAEEAAVLEEGLPRLRRLTIEAIVVAFQRAADRVIGDSLRLSG